MLYLSHVKKEFNKINWHDNMCMKTLDWRDENYMMVCSWDGALPLNHQINLAPLNNAEENEGESAKGEDPCASVY